jgi:outer membrane protein W
MKKTVLSTIATIALTTSLSAEVKPYIGLGYNSFTIKYSNAYEKDSINNSSSSIPSPSESGGTTVLNGGIILTNHSKINLSYFTAKPSDTQDDTEPTEMTVSVVGVSYNHSFNNFGTRKGFYIGGGLSNVKVEFDESVYIKGASQSSTGILFKGGFEYKTDDNILFDIGLTINTAKQDHVLNRKYRDGTTSKTSTYTVTTEVSHMNISVSYLF